MQKRRWLTVWLGLILLTSRSAPGLTQTAEARIDEALQNVTVLVRADRVGYATFWDGNKFVQCRRMPDRQLRCEAAGTTMQPSLRNVLTGDRLQRLAALGWTLDASFGNYTHNFAAELPSPAIASQIAQILLEAYAANLGDLEVSTRWVADTPCPPRAGPSQNLAGSVNDTASMRFFVVRTCSYVAKDQIAQAVGSVDELIACRAPPRQQNCSGCASI
jgi:hypothetical protein